MKARYLEEPLRALDSDGSSPDLLCIINLGQRANSIYILQAALVSTHSKVSIGLSIMERHLQV